MLEYDVFCIYNGVVSKEGKGGILKSIKHFVYVRSIHTVLLPVSCFVLITRTLGYGGTRGIS